MDIVRSFESEDSTEEYSRSPPRRATRAVREEEHLVPLLPFCPSNIRSVLLHPDLVNEPYSIHDSGVRPELSNNHRPFFYFEGRSHLYAICKVGSLTFGNDKKPDRKILAKKSSYTSIIDVYDSYGLEVAHSYLKSLYHSQMSLKHPAWFATYLLGSLAVVQPEYAASLADKKGCHHSSALILLYCSLLISELISLDSKQPRLLLPLQRHNTVLLPELLAKIFRSERISKAIAAYVRESKRTTILREGELQSLAEGPMTRSGLGYFCLTDEEVSWSITMNEGDQFSLRFQEGIYALEGAVVFFSLKDWIRVYNRRKLDGKSLVRKKLLNLNQIEVGPGSVNEICACIVQLSYETGRRESKLIFGYTELEETFRELIALALNNYSIDE